MSQDIFRNVKDSNEIVRLSPAYLAGFVLEDLAYDGQAQKLNRTNFAMYVCAGYPSQMKAEVTMAISTALSWLEDNGYLVQQGEPGWFDVSDKGKTIAKASDLHRLLAQNRRLENRVKMLEVLCQESGGDDSVYLDFRDLAKREGLTDEETDDVISYFKNEDLIKDIDNGFVVKISHRGRLWTEKKNPKTPPREYQPPPHANLRRSPHNPWRAGFFYLIAFVIIVLVLIILTKQVTP